jgi:hypothetical protein
MASADGLPLMRNGTERIVRTFEVTTSPGSHLHA